MSSILAWSSEFFLNFLVLEFLFQIIQFRSVSAMCFTRRVTRTGLKKLQNAGDELATQNIITSNVCKENCNNLTKAFEMTCLSKSVSKLLLIHEGGVLSLWMLLVCC